MLDGEAEIVPLVTASRVEVVGPQQGTTDLSTVGIDQVSKTHLGVIVGHRIARVFIPVVVFGDKAVAVIDRECTLGHFVDPAGFDLRHLALGFKPSSCRVGIGGTAFETSRRKLLANPQCDLLKRRRVVALTHRKQRVRGVVIDVIAFDNRTHTHRRDGQGRDTDFAGDCLT